MDSCLRCYKLKDYDKPKTTYSSGIKWIKKGDAYKTISMPTKSEQVSSYKDKMYLIFESGSSVYSSIFYTETDCYLVLDIDKILS